MSISSTRGPLMAVMIALFLGLFTLGPALDLATCGPSPASEAADLLVVADVDCDIEACETGAHGCVHGHCHSPSDRPPVGLDAPTLWTVADPLGGPRDHASTSVLPERLPRPPEA